MARPTPQEYPPYFKTYIDLVEGDDIIQTLNEQLTGSYVFFQNIPEDKLTSAYEPGKWTIKEVLCHIIDTERIMAYRALRFARKDQVDLPGFEQDNYIKNSDCNSRSLDDLMYELSAVRTANTALFRSFPEEVLDYQGTADGKTYSVRSIPFIIAGHELHHIKVIAERYL